MQLKLDERSDIVNTMLGKGRCTWEDEYVSVKLFVKHCFHLHNWILVVTRKWY